MKRFRRSGTDIAAIRHALSLIVERDQPMSVRQVFYRAVVGGLVDKTEAEYRTVARLLVEMRRDGTIPHSWIADGTRWMRRPAVYAGLDAFIRRHQFAYRRDIWAELSEYVEIWAEKDALAGILYDVTEEFGVPLMISRGFASESYLYSAAETITNAFRAGKRRAYIYYLGDYDPSGLKIPKTIDTGLRRLCKQLTMFDDERLQFVRVAVTPEQIEEMNLPTRPTKIAGNSHARDWDPDRDSVELDAIDPQTLRTMVEDCIFNHVDERRLAMLRQIEAEEREQLVLFGQSLRT